LPWPEAVFLAVGVALQGFTYLSAPAMALLADRDLRGALDVSALNAEVGEDIAPLGSRAHVAQTPTHADRRL
jgi:hypothetical protein